MKLVKQSIRKAPLYLSLSMATFSLHPIQLFHRKSNTICLLRKSNTTNSSSTSAPKFSGALPNNMAVTAHQRISFFNEHILVLDLHILSAAQIPTFLFCLAVYFIAFPIIYIFLFLPLTSLFVFCFPMKLVDLILIFTIS